jgi:hypothetical protein
VVGEKIWLWWPMPCTGLQPSDFRPDKMKVQNYRKQPRKKKGQIFFLGCVVLSYNTMEARFWLQEPGGFAEKKKLCP